MRMRPVTLAILASLAWLAWFASAIAVERHRAALHGAVVTPSDYPLCVTVRPPPLQPPRKVVLHPGNSELS